MEINRNNSCCPAKNLPIFEPFRTLFSGQAISNARWSQELKFDLPKWIKSKSVDSEAVPPATPALCGRREIDLIFSTHWVGPKPACRKPLSPGSVAISWYVPSVFCIENNKTD
ncbi:hypothetical protein TNCT_440621 [Trichonephila clavata]|uniref:Uncharacterized protein n=1 Tax=Trichonephila clavata TaxID=2740835 RepID=A0A8X6GIC7_TRICU|nr:hypothetical protein TNCT_440621 [Trichonephila clavata]